MVFLLGSCPARETSRDAWGWRTQSLENPQRQKYHVSGRNKGVVLAGGSFRKWVRVPIGVLGGGVWGRVQVSSGWVVFLLGKQGKSVGGGGVGTGKGTGKSMRTRLSKPPFSKLPFNSQDRF